MPAHPVAILQGVDINVNYTLIMLNCVVVGCSNVSGRDGKSFYRIPAVIRGQGARTLELSSERRDKWVSAIKRVGWAPTQYGAYGLASRNAKANKNPMVLCQLCGTVVIG